MKLFIIREHQPDSNYIFWPDSAGCNYSKQTLARMDKNVKFVPKEINPPNIPQSRPIPICFFFAQKVYEGCCLRGLNGAAVNSSH